MSRRGEHQTGEHRLIVLLRGVNVGGAKKVSMAQLAGLLASLGYSRVATHLNSGNAVLSAPDGNPRAVELAISEAVRAEVGMPVEVLVRTRDELAAIVALDPLAAVATDPSRSLVCFLSATPDPLALAGLTATDFAPESFVLHGRELYLWCPNGIHDSPVAKAMSDKRLGVTATARNQNTVRRLLTLADSA